LSYEVDLWGRLSRAEQAARATLLSRAHDRRAVVQTLVASVVLTWLEIRELEAQLSLTERTTRNFRDNRDLVEERYRRGLVPPLDLRLARQNLATALAKRPQDLQNLAAARRRLEILLGRYPAGDLIVSPQGYDPEHLPEPLPQVPAGIPSTLLERRPDLVAAELRLAAATADIGAAKAQLFPRVALTAEGGSRSTELSELFTDATSIWSLVGNIAMPLLNRGAQKSQIEAAEARAYQAVAAYRAAVLEAFRDVEAALAAERYQRERAQQLRVAVEEARRSLALAEERYRRGLDNLLLTLDAQRRLYEAERALLVTERLLGAARVELIIALGGSWDVEVAPPGPVAVSREDSDG
jgi:multidrug efflux system outer membrane protein